MIDHRRSQLDKARRERRELIAEHVTFEQFQTNCKQKKYPAGSTYAWAAECVFGPVGSAEKEKNNATHQPIGQTGTALQSSERAPIQQASA